MTFLASELATALAMRVLPQPGRAVEEDALGGGQLVLVEEVLVEERQLDRVGDLLDLAVEAADVGVGDVGHLLEHELLDLGTGQPLEQQPRAAVHEDVVAGPQGLGADEVLGELDDPLLVGPTHDEGPPAAFEHLVEGDDLAGDLGPAGHHHVERLVEHHLGAPLHVVLGRGPGWTETRILRPPEKTSTVPSSLVASRVP